MKKLLVVGVIGLFLGLAIAPVINVSTIAFTTSDKNKFSLKLTEEKFNKLIFNDFPMRYRYITENGQFHTIITSRLELLDERSRYYGEEEPTLIITPTDGGNHSPIYINGNENFTYDNGVTSGSGTENDPYIIENWIIVGNTSVKRGIYVRNSDVYFIIRNCITSNFLGWGHMGIEFSKVENGKIEHTEMYNNYYGVFITDSSYIAIVNCTSHDNYGEYATGINGIRCSNITIDSCKCYNNTGRATFGIHFEKGSYIFIENTLCYNNEWSGIEIFTDNSTNYPCVYNTIKDCKIYNNTISGGIDLWSTWREKHRGYNLITGCEIYNNGHWSEPVGNAFPGISIWNLHNNIIENCDIHHNGDGVYIAECSNNIIRNCTIHDQWQPTFMGNGVLILGLEIDGLLGFSWNNTIEQCNIYGQDCGIWNTEALRTKIYKNNISNNNYIGIEVSNFLGISSAQINYNNICGNGYMDKEDGYGLSGYPISFIDARNNWWDSEKGPSRLLFPFRGDRLVKLLSIVQYRPWLTEPVSDAGVQE